MSQSPPTDDLERSPAAQFGHCRKGYAVEFELGGIACRSMTVESQGEAETLQTHIAAKDRVKNAEVVRDA